MAPRTTTWFLLATIALAAGTGDEREEGLEFKRHKKALLSKLRERWAADATVEAPLQPAGATAAAEVEAAPGRSLLSCIGEPATCDCSDAWETCVYSHADACLFSKCGGSKDDAYQDDCGDDDGGDDGDDDDDDTYTSLETDDPKRECRTYSPSVKSACSGDTCYICAKEYEEYVECFYNYAAYTSYSGLNCSFDCVNYLSPAPARPAALSTALALLLTAAGVAAAGLA